MINFALGMASGLILSAINVLVLIYILIRNLASPEKFVSAVEKRARGKAEIYDFIVPQLTLNLTKNQ